MRGRCLTRSPDLEALEAIFTRAAVPNSRGPLLPDLPLEAVRAELANGDSERGLAFMTRIF